MRIGTTHLFTPGSTNLPDPVRQAMNAAMQDQNTPEFSRLTRSLLNDLKRVFKTESGQVVLFPGSGTAACEAAITNTLNPGDRVLMARHGMFSARLVEMAQRLGLDVEVVDLAWGAACPARQFARRLAADAQGRIKAVFVIHNETATGVTSDIAAVRRALDATFHDALLCVDGVSSIGAIDFRMDDWGVDLAVTDSRHGLMLPAGLGILGVSAKALAASRTATLPRAWFNLADQVPANATGSFPGTPATPLLHGLRAALDRLLSEGLENVFTRHARLAAGVRAAVQDWGLRIVAEDPARASQTVTAIRVPDGVDAREVIRIGHDRYACSFGSGLGPLASTVFRIGHLGDLNEGMCLTAIALAELSLHAAGMPVTFGSGVAAAQAIYADPPRDIARIAAE